MTNEQAEEKAQEIFKRFDIVDLVLLIPVAVFFDFISIIPLLGNICLILLLLVFYFKGVNIKKISKLWVVSMGIKAIPFVSIFPAITMFVGRAYLLNRAEGKAVQNSEGIEGASNEEKTTQSREEKIRARASKEGQAAGPEQGQGQQASQAKGSDQQKRDSIANQEEKVKDEAELKQRPSERSSGPGEAQPDRFSSDTDQFGTKMGPEGEFGVSGGPTAQPSPQRERSHQAGTSTPPRASSSKPTNAVLRARQTAKEKEDKKRRGETVEELLEERQLDRTKDQFGQRGPTTPEKPTVATGPKKNS
ncbi:MAG: hypothetical protein COU10_00340 [Candidatus Harrisonbacteria bacterium CG10_big_fil_rev_8_21_14_0_10_45_28]|uniref:Uncharacterized protein n=1 Tax=Candidatus Harrisonbacteria bacterium CG10_big_fil_rev_8_21_14_0_10_45_28 TaxID=1974586 RepID=A0A2H0UP81_9BACT|nr:MAG: hypothetical protein COU10_00340 [Candidatus Harrisonbacteria bacterium CG10_big_fil_rev_8_21_14_0_10_45_28]